MVNHEKFFTNYLIISGCWGMNHYRGKLCMDNFQLLDLRELTWNGSLNKK